MVFLLYFRTTIIENNCTDIKKTVNFYVTTVVNKESFLRVVMSTEVRERISLLQSQRISRLGHCKPEFRLKWLKQKGAVLVVVWSFLVNSVFHFVVLGL